MSRRRGHANKKDKETAGRVPNVNVATPSEPRRQGRARNARSIPDETMMVLDKIGEYQNFFESLEAIFSNVDNVNLVIEAARTSTRSIYKLCEGQKKCRDAFQSLSEGMNSILDYDVEELGSMLKMNASVRAAFEAIVDIVEEISVFIEEQNRGLTSRFLRLGRDVQTSYESRLDALRDKLKRGNEGLRDSINLERNNRMMLDDLKLKLEGAANTCYSSDEGCLEHTRTGLLTEVDTWIKGLSTEKTMWIYGRFGSGKSALFNSIAENLKNACIPFTCFTCKWSDTELSNARRILQAISYGFAEVYDDYRSTIHGALKEKTGYTVNTINVKKQSELLFGKSYELIFPEGSNRPPVHVILIDALDACRSRRNRDETVHERRDLLEVLLDFASTVPWIRVLVTSRPEPDIAGVFKGTTYPVHRIDINCDKWKPTPAAMRHFLLVTSNRLDIDLSHDQIERFRGKASDSFKWYMVIFSYIKEVQENRRRVIESILEDPSPVSPSSLYFLYQRALDSAVSEPNEKELVESILGVVFISSTLRPLSATAITSMLYPEERGEGLRGKRAQVYRIIKSLSVILNVEEGTDHIQVIHDTVLDFIGRVLSGDIPTMSTGQRLELEPFSMRVEEMHARIFERCLAIMKRELRFNICDLDDSRRLNKDVPDLPARISHSISGTLRYASLFWMSHLEQSGVKGRGEQVFAFLDSLLALYWIEVLSLLDAIDRGIVALQDCMGFFATGSNVLGIANEWERFLLSYGDASKSTPHLYLSALSWIPSRSSLWDIVHGSFSSELPLVSNVPAAWKSERWSESVGTPVKSVAYSPDGRFFAAGCFGGSIRFWDARSRKKEKESFMTRSWVLSIAISPDSHWLASGHSDHKIRLWDLRVDSPVPRFLEGHTESVTSVAFSSDGRKLVSGSDGGTIRIWNVDSGTAIGSLRGHYSGVGSVTFFAGETHIISCFINSIEEEMRIWNVETGEQIGKSLEGRSVDCSRDGKFIASGCGDGTIILWDAQTYKQTGELTGHTSDVSSVCFSFDSKRIASGSYDNSVRIWNVDTRSMVCELKGHTSKVTSVSFSPDGHSVLSGSRDGTVRSWDVKEAAPVDQPSTKSAEVLCVSYVPGSGLIVSGSRDGDLELWDAQTGAAVANPMQGHTDAVNALAVSSDDRWLVSGSDDYTVRIWDVVSRAPIGKPIHGHTNRVTSVAVSPDNQLVASASVDKTIRLWDVTTRESVRALKGHEEAVSFVTFSVDGNRVISGSSDSTVRLWDTRTGEAVGHPLKVHSDWVTAVAVSPDGQWIASGTWDGTVRIWSMTTLSVIHVLKGHSRWVRSVTFSPNSQFLISGSHDGIIRIWSVQIGEAVGDALTGHTSEINSVTFVLDGHEFASGSDDGTIRVWDTRARTDLAMKRERVIDYDELSEEELLVKWNASRACVANDDGWVKDQEKLLLWVPWQYRDDIYGGTRLALGALDSHPIRPQVDYRKISKYSGTRWMGFYTGKNT